MADADTPPSSVTIRRSGEERPRLRPRVRFGAGQRVHTYNQGNEVDLSRREGTQVEDSGPETDTESVGGPPPKRSMLSKGIQRR